ncbi:MAG: hypothetical protein ACQERB_06535 [Promethearchaeati archaeon]
MNDNKDEHNLNEKGEKSKRPEWWTPFWIAMGISMIGSGIFSYFFLSRDFIRILILEIVFLIVLGLAYYFRVNPSKKANKIAYILLGITPIGFGLWVVYAVFCGLTNFCHFLNNLEPYGFLINLTFQLLLYVVGGFIGNWIGKKRDYKLPLSSY